MIFTRKSLIQLIIPLILEQTLSVTIGMADTLMVAVCGEAAVSGISLVDSINLLLINLLSALTLGGAVITSQYIGKGDIHSGCQSTNQLMISVATLSSAIMLIALIFRQQILSFIFGAIEADVMENALIYFMVTALSYPFLALYNSGAALFRSMGNSKLSLYTSLVMNLLNVAGNALFIFVFDMGVFGAALATLLSRIFGSVFMIYMLSKPGNLIHLEKLFPLVIRWDMIKNILRIGIPSGLENSVFQIGKVMISSLVASFGTVVIAANAVAGNIFSIQCIPGSAIGLAMVTVVGQCVGAREYEQAKKYTYRLMLLCMICTGVVCLVTCLGASQISALYKLTDETAKLAANLIIFHGSFAPIFWPPSFALPNALRGASDVKFTMIASMISMWSCRILLAYLLGDYFGMGIYGVFTAMIGDWIVRGSFFGYRFIKGKWQNKAYI